MPLDNGKAPSVKSKASQQSAASRASRVSKASKVSKASRVSKASKASKRSAKKRTVEDLKETVQIAAAAGDAVATEIQKEEV